MALSERDARDIRSFCGICHIPSAATDLLIREGVEPSRVKAKVVEYLKQSVARVRGVSLYALMAGLVGDEKAKALFGAAVLGAKAPPIGGGKKTAAELWDEVIAEQNARRSVRV